MTPKPGTPDPLKTQTDAEMSVMIDLSVDDDVFIKVAAVGARVATDQDYFSVGARHILQEQFSKEDSVEETD